VGVAVVVYLDELLGFVRVQVVVVGESLGDDVVVGVGDDDGEVVGHLVVGLSGAAFEEGRVPFEDEPGGAAGWQGEVLEDVAAAEVLDGDGAAADVGGGGAPSVLPGEIAVIAGGAGIEDAVGRRLVHRFGDDPVIEKGRIEEADVIEDNASAGGIGEGGNARGEDLGRGQTGVEGQAGAGRQVVNDFEHGAAFVG